MNLLNFIKTFGKKTFAQLPFCDADALVYSRLSYLNWEMTLDENDHDTHKVIKIRDFADSKRCKEITKGDLDQKEAIAFLVALSTARRYKHIRVGHVKKIFSKENSIQFCAMSFFNKEEEPIIAFRGTDTSLVGWKEDLSLAFKTRLRSQSEALKYVEKFSETHEGKFKIVGHSKGGNLAAYTLYTMSDNAYSHLSEVYNLDGPGFLDPNAIFTQERLQTRSHLMKKYVPMDSLVGILLKQTCEYHVVESYKFLVSQHNPLNWKIDDKTHQLKFSKKRNEVSKTFEESTTKWIDSTSPHDIDIASTYIIEFLGGYDNNVLSIISDIPGTYRAFSEKYKQEPPEIQMLVKKTFLGLLIAAREIVFPIKMPGINLKK